MTEFLEKMNKINELKQAQFLTELDLKKRK